MLWVYWRIGKGDESPIYDNHLDLPASIEIEALSPGPEGSGPGFHGMCSKALEKVDFSLGNAAIAKPWIGRDRKEQHPDTWDGDIGVDGLENPETPNPLELSKPTELSHLHL